MDKISKPYSEADLENLTLIERLFFAYRDFIGDPDRILDQYGFGRAHHRVLYFVNRRPGLTVADLLEILRITKQSLARVLSDLVHSGYVVQQEGLRDRRQRLLYPTAAGRKLIASLSLPQSRRIGRALDGFNQTERQTVERFFERMTNEPPADE